MGKRTCSIKGCQRNAEKRGWCAMHYRRWQRYGDPLTLRHASPAPGRDCSVDGCAEPAITRGWCYRHWGRWRKYGDPLAGPRFRVRRGSQIGVTCSIEGCKNPALSRNWCRMHYARWERGGDPLVVQSRGQGRGIPVEDRFWPYVKPQADGCWLWERKPNSSGYGTIGVEGRSVLVHRFAYELLVGPIPEGLTIDHVKNRGCTSKLCVKAIADEHGPAHLEPVTYGENVRRAQAAYKARMDARTHCMRGHPWNAVNTYMNSNGSRVCQACRAERRAQRRADARKQES